MKAILLCTLLSWPSVLLAETDATLAEEREAQPIPPPEVIEPAPDGGPTDGGPPEFTGGGVGGALDFQGDEIGTVLRLLARQAGVNLFVDDTVEGTLTMRIEGKSPLDSIRFICRARGLNLNEDGRDFYVSTGPVREPRDVQLRRVAKENAAYFAAYRTELQESGFDPEISRELMLKSEVPAEISARGKASNRWEGNESDGPFSDWANWGEIAGAGILAFIASGFGLGWTVAIVFAVIAWRDARMMKREKRLKWLWPVAWSLAVLSLGAPGFILYWLVHHTALLPAMDSTASPSA